MKIAFYLFSINGDYFIYTYHNYEFVCKRELTKKEFKLMRTRLAFMVKYRAIERSEFSTMYNFHN